MTLDFFAYAPAVFGENPVFAEDDIQYKPSDSNGKIMSFDYTVPGSGESVTNAAELQPDIMFAYSSQNKKATDPATGSVPLKFYHALAGVKFVAKDITGGTVKSITLKNLYGTGTCTYTFTTDSVKPSIVWTGLNGQDCSFSQGFNVTVNNQQTGEQDITDKNPETTFMMIPQNIENAVVEILLGDSAECRDNEYDYEHKCNRHACRCENLLDVLLHVASLHCPLGIFRRNGLPAGCLRRAAVSGRVLFFHIIYTMESD